MAGKNKRKSYIIYVVIFLVVFAGLYIYINVVPKVSKMFTTTYTAEYGTLDASIDVNYIAVRHEKTYEAKSSGMVTRIVSEGEAKRAQTAIVAIDGTKTYSDMRGIVSYSYDGLEDVLSPDMMDTLVPEDVQKFAASDYKLKTCDEKESTAGNIAFKIVDNQTWYLVIWLNPDEAGQLRKNRAVKIEMEDGTLLSMKVDEVNRTDGDSRVILSCTGNYEKFDTIRVGKARFIKSTATGIVLETASITTVDDVLGVYVINNYGTTSFKPVKVLLEVGEKTVVEKNYFYDSEGNSVGTVKNYDTIQRIKKKTSKDDEEGEEDVD